jgi:phage terminase large subunit
MVRYSRRTAGAEGPILFVRELLGAEPDVWQEEALRAYGRGERRISVRSGHGVGKTTLLAWILVHHMLTEVPQKSVCTAPTNGQLFDALAAETKAWFKKLKPELRALVEIKSDRIELVGAPEESFISFRTSSAERPEALAGVHSENVLLLADEASGIPEQIYEAAAGSMSTEGATTILAGNPVRSSGLFYDTHHLLKDQWYTIHASCEKSRFVTKDFITDMERRYGRESNAFRVRVLGDFPRSGDDNVIPRDVAELALSREVEPAPVRPVWGLDPARKGADPSGFAKRKGNALMEPVKVRHIRDSMELVGWVLNEWRETPLIDRPETIMVDEIGIGGPVCDRLRELGLPAFGVNVAESASLSERYQRLRDEMWFTGRDWVTRRNCRLWGLHADGTRWEDNALVEELCAPVFSYMSSGKIVVESKEAMKKRLPRLGSPNRADAFLLTLMHDAGVASGGQTANSWNEAIQFRLPGLV